MDWSCRSNGIFLIFTNMYLLCALAGGPHHPVIVIDTRIPGGVRRIDWSAYDDEVTARRSTRKYDDTICSWRCGRSAPAASGVLALEVLPADRRRDAAERMLVGAGDCADLGDDRQLSGLYRFLCRRTLDGSRD
jgi:hypothetical protein